MSTIESTPLEAEIATFALSVGHHLDDLPAEEVDELIEDLAADMAEQAADRGDDFVLPDAATYAEELRSAAGLPPRAEDAKAPTVRAIITGNIGARLRALRAHPVSAATIDFLISLRPAWWLARAVILFVAFSVMTRGTWFSYDLLDALPLAACVIVSVQWGRGRWLPQRGGDWIKGVVNVVAWIAFPVISFGALNAFAQSQQYDYGQLATYSSQPGLTNDGVRVRNIFAYDSGGQPITGVQLFDQDGQPLTTVGRDGLYNDWDRDEYFSGGGGPVPVAESGPGLQPIWNIYPLRELPAGTEWMQPRPEATTPAFPFPRVPLSGTGDGFAATPTPTAYTETSAPTPSTTPPEPAPTASPTP